MSKWHHRSVRWSWLASVLAVVGLGLATVPASASPSTVGLDRPGDRPLSPIDPSAIVGRVGPQVVDISTKFGYNNAVGPMCTVFDPAPDRICPATPIAVPIGMAKPCPPDIL